MSRVEAKRWCSDGMLILPMTSAHYPPWTEMPPLSRLTGGNRPSSGGRPRREVKHSVPSVGPRCLAERATTHPLPTATWFVRSAHRVAFHPTVWQRGTGVRQANQGRNCAWHDSLTWPPRIRPDEVLSFRDAAHEMPHHVLFRTAVHTGLRRSELPGLGRCDADGKPLLSGGKHFGEDVDRLPGIVMFGFELWSQREDSNPRPAVYKTAALPLSYAGPPTGIIPKNGKLGNRSRRLTSLNVADANRRVWPIVPALDKVRALLDNLVWSGAVTASVARRVAAICRRAPEAERGGVGERLIPADCKSAARNGYVGSNPTPSTMNMPT